MRWILSGSVAALMATIPVLPASAQQQATPVCGSHDDITGKLQGEFSEKRVGFGLGHSGQMIEVFASRDGATWSMLVTVPSGETCLVSAGEAWQMPAGQEQGPYAWLTPDTE